MKIGLFGGAFNPVHNGHINLAKCYMDYLGLDRIIFIPTAVPPHKSSQDLISGENRINMLKLAVKEHKGFVVSDIEFKRAGKSYTYDTVCQLKNQYKEDDFYLIIGADQFFSFDKWYKYEELLDMVTLCTAARNNAGENERLIHCSKKYKNSIVLLFDVIVLSSSEIRSKIKCNQDISNLVPKVVNDYIKENKLYAKI